MVRIAHISDSHLGAAMFQLVERREDARVCLKRAVEMAMKHSPDILVHTGDLFDSPDATTEEITAATKVFRRAQDHDIDVFVLQGNHDLAGRHRSASPITVLETTGLVTSTGDSNYRRVKRGYDAQRVEIHLLSWGSKRATLAKIASLRPTTDGISLLFAHTTSTKWSELPGFDYIGEGHHHNFRLDEELCVGTPGSTCIVDWRKELGRNRTRRLIVADVDSSGAEFTTEELRDVRTVRLISGLNITGMGPKEVNEFLTEKIERIGDVGRNAIVIVEVTGDINTDTQAAIDRQELISRAEKRLRPLMIHIEPKWRVHGPRPVMLTDPLDPVMSVKEYAVFEGLSNVEDILELLQQIMR